MGKASNYAVDVIVHAKNSEKIEKTYIINAGSILDAKVNALVLAKNEYMTNMVEIDDYLRLS